MYLCLQQATSGGHSYALRKSHWREGWSDTLQRCKAYVDILYSTILEDIYALMRISSLYNVRDWLLMCAFIYLLQHILVRHVLDVMPIENNITESVVNFLFMEKDTTECKRDLEEVWQRHVVWLTPRPNRSRFHKPPSSYVFTNADMRIFVDEVCSVRTHTRYGSALATYYKKSRFFGLTTTIYCCSN